MTEPNRRRRLPLVGALVAVLAVTGIDVTAEGQSAPAANPPALLPAGETYTVTLLTGDVVTVTGAASGCPVVSVRPANPSGVMSRSCGPDGHVRVVPGTVAPLIDTTLDPALFDVTALILDGYDDARSTDLPLIVQPGGEARAATSDPLVAGLTASRALPSIAAVAGRHAKTTGADFLGSVTARAATAPAKVWLDRRVRTTAGPQLDQNLRQIAAPQAWNAGYTGEGTRVAVLDTGVDATHPDLVGKVAESMDFTVEGGDAGDRYGHGTHVAATIAGTGAASNGARKGVAPDAQLLNGKVLADNGEGTDSMVIAGMEWAASRADVVNLSLGGWDPSDGTDPLSLALDTLTDQTGALFVVAAGNSGPLDGTVSSPGAAASALTVGAVDGDDVVADFSSRGPLINTRAAKPEIVAPGVDIVAARAAGTTMGPPIDEHYAVSSGTSMASPHVAGAAAVLAQRHPDWQAGRLKAALVGASDPIDDGDAYTNGAGRLDVAAALSGVVSTQALVNVAQPESEAKLGWHNTGTRAATVALDVTVIDHHGDPVSGASLADRRLRIDAGAESGTKLTIDRAAFDRPGLYTATVTARVGRDVTRTPVTFYVEPPSHDLTVATTAVPGTPEGEDAWATVWVINLDDPAIYYHGESADAGQTVTFRVPAGRYTVMGSFMTSSVDDGRMALAGDPDLEIAGDTSLTLDLSEAKRLAASVDGVATEANSLGLTYIQTPRRGPGWTDFAFAWGDSAKAGNVFLAPNDGTDIGTFDAYGSFGLDAPGSGMSPYLYDLIHPFGNGIPDDPTYRVTAAEQETLARIDQKFNRLDLPDSLTSHKRYGVSDEGVFLAENYTEPLSGDRTDYVSSEFAWLDEAFWNGQVTQEALARYEPGSRQEKVWVRQPLRSDWYDDPAGSLSGCEPAPPSRTSGNLHIELVTLTDEHQRFDCLADGWGLDMTRKVTLERDGELVGTAEYPFADFTVPREASDYRLTYDVDTSRALSVSTRVTTAWTFRSAGPKGTDSAPLPLLSVDYALPLDVANHPTSGVATFTVRQAHGVREQAITSFGVAVSLDKGATWADVPVSRVDGAFQAQLPEPAAGQSVSLRVTAKGKAGSGIEQTIVDAYRAG